jgi:hypothetical protein
MIQNTRAQAVVYLLKGLHSAAFQSKWLVTRRSRRQRTALTD